MATSYPARLSGAGTETALWKEVAERRWQREVAEGGSAGRRAHAWAVRPGPCVHALATISTAVAVVDAVGALEDPWIGGVTRHSVGMSAPKRKPQESGLYEKVKVAQASKLAS